jgi:peptidoglycan/xylan/chitin deacetylase (PgdA/CDA1 family)
VLWAVLGWDWEDGADAAAIAGHVLANVHPGAIVCLHDGAPRAPDAPDPRAATVAALPLVLDGLSAAGLEPVALHELLDEA